VTESMSRAFRVVGQDPVTAFELEPDLEGARIHATPGGSTR
jgi:hypothetical protein